MRNREKMLASMKMIEIGIAPYMYSSQDLSENEIESALESLSETDRKKAKRKSNSNQKSKAKITVVIRKNKLLKNCLEKF